MNIADCIKQPWLTLALIGIGTTSCTEEKTGGSVNLFTIQDDIDLGQQLRAEIEADPETYPLLDPAEYPEAYQYLYNLRDTILASGLVTHADDFEWELHIINDDETLNAFCAPGGYIYVYTGLIKFLEYEDELAGVMGHEMAHADLRHSTEQLTKAYGIGVLISLLTGGDPGLLAEVAGALVNLSFSRSDESEADQASVDYLCTSGYAANGTAGFFEKIEGMEIPEFLSTHPSSATRVEDINQYALDMECNLEYNPNSDYQGLINALPATVAN